MPISPEKARRYPADRARRRRFIIKYRGRGRCEWCGAVNYEPFDTQRSDGGNTPG